MKKKELLNEIMGVPKALTPWINSITQIIYDDASTLDEWDESGPVSYTDEDGEVVEGDVVDSVNNSQSESLSDESTSAS